MKEHEEIEQHKKLPRVGQTVKNKKFGTLWRVMEKREVWKNIDENHLIAGIHLTFWQIKKSEMPGTGKTIGFVYTDHDNTFESNWEIVK